MRTQYLIIGQPYSLLMSNVTFSGLSYGDSLMQDTYALSFSLWSISPGKTTNTQLNSVTFQNCGIGFLQYGASVNINNTNNFNTNYYLDITQLVATNNYYQRVGSLIDIQSFVEPLPVQLRIINSTMSNNMFLVGGNLILCNFNSLLPLVLQNVTFTNNTNGNIYMQPSNTILLTMPQQIQVINCNFTQNFPNLSATFVSFTNSKLYVQGSLFNKNYGMSRGSIVQFDYQQGYAYFTNTTITNNFAMQGGVFFCQYSGLIEIQNCTLSANTALFTSIARMEDQCYFHFDNSTFTGNHAMDSSLLSLQDSIEQQSVLSNSILTQNTVYSSLSSLAKGLPTIVVQQVQNNSFLQVYNSSSTSTIASMFLSQSSLLIQNCSFITDSQLISSYQSKVQIFNVTFSTFVQKTTQQSYITLVQSSLNMQGSLFTGFSYQNKVVVHNQFLIKASLLSNIQLQDTQFSDGSSQIIYFENSQAQITNVTVTRLTMYSMTDRVVYLDASNTNVSNSSWTNISTQNIVYFVTRTDSFMFNNFSITNCASQFFYSMQTQVTVLSSIFNSSSPETTSTDRAFQMSQGSISIYNSSYFGYFSLDKGGAMYLINVDLILYQSVFLYNEANQGGAIYLSCSTSQFCNYTIINNTFDGNVATSMGGAIAYDKYKPQQYVNNTFGNLNYAPYGSQLGGYAFGVSVRSYDTSIMVASGQDYQGIIIVDVVDYDGQTISTDSSTSIAIIQYEPLTKVSSQYTQKVVNGRATFSDIIFTAPPGSQNVSFQVYSPSINTAYLIQTFGADSDPNIDYIQLNFRDCVVGEVEVNYQCIECAATTYSLDTSDPTCYDCMDNAECEGGSFITVDPGYWRSTFNSTNIIQCFTADSCIGGNYTEGYSSYDNTEDFPLCAYGYGGNLCHKCIDVDGIQFTRSGEDGCAKCPNKIINILELTGIFLAMLAGMAVLIWINVRHQKESQTSAVTRIALNYVQIMSTAAAYNLKWPNMLSTFMGVYASVGQVADSYISFDCFLQDSGFSQNGGSTYYFKVMMMVLLPLIACICFAIFFYLVKMIKKQSRTQFIRHVIVASITVLYSIYPTITKMTASLYFCVELDPGQMWLREDLEVQCWTPQHLRWSFLIGLPSIIVWIFGIPIIGFAYLYYHRKQLMDPIIFGRYRMIYQGLKTEYFWWEFVNIFRKVTLVSINVFLNLQSNMFKAMLGLMFLFSLLRLQNNIRPYKNPVINELEARENLTTVVTFFGSLYFLTDVSDLIQLIVFCVIVVTNAWFFGLWVYCLTKTLGYSFSDKIANILGKLVVSQQSRVLEAKYLKSRSEFITYNTNRSTNTVKSDTTSKKSSRKDESISVTNKSLVIYEGEQDFIRSKGTGKQSSKQSKNNSESSFKAMQKIFTNNKKDQKSKSNKSKITDFNDNTNTPLDESVSQTHTQIMTNVKTVIEAKAKDKSFKTRQSHFSKGVNPIEEEISSVEAKKNSFNNTPGFQDNKGQPKKVKEILSLDSGSRKESNKDSNFKFDQNNRQVMPVALDSSINATANDQFQTKIDNKPKRQTKALIAQPFDMFDSEDLKDILPEGSQWTREDLKKNFLRQAQLRTQQRLTEKTSPKKQVKSNEDEDVLYRFVVKKKPKKKIH